MLAGMPADSPVTLRSRWNLAQLGLAALSLAGGLALLAHGQAGMALVLAAYLSAQGCWGLLRVPFYRIVVGTAGVTSHGVLRNRTYDWASITDVRVEEVGDVLVAKWWAPSLVLADGRTVMLMQVSGPAERAATSVATVHAARLAAHRPA